MIWTTPPDTNFYQEAISKALSYSNNILVDDIVQNIEYSVRNATDKYYPRRTVQIGNDKAKA